MCCTVEQPQNMMPHEGSQVHRALQDDALYPNVQKQIHREALSDLLVPSAGVGIGHTQHKRTSWDGGHILTTELGQCTNGLLSLPLEMACIFPGLCFPCLVQRQLSRAMRALSLSLSLIFLVVYGTLFTYGAEN